MRNELRLRPFDSFSEAERRTLSDLAREGDWTLVFIHHQAREREFGYLYAGTPVGRPAWLVAREGPAWLLSDVASGEVSRLDSLAQLAEVLGAKAMAARAA